MGFVLIGAFLYLVHGVQASFHACDAAAAGLTCQESIGPAERYQAAHNGVQGASVVRRVGVVLDHRGQVVAAVPETFAVSAPLEQGRAVGLADAFGVRP